MPNEKLRDGLCRRLTCGASQEEKMEIEHSRWWFQQDQCHRGKKVWVKCTQLLPVIPFSLLLPVYLPSVFPAWIQPTHHCCPYFRPEAHL